MSKVDWTIVEREVIATLRARRWTAHEAHDLAQTTVERAIKFGVDDRWTTKRAVAWSVRVALNAAVDERRRRAHYDTGEVPDTAAAYSIEDSVLARLELQAVGQALLQLNSRDRALVLDHDRGPAGDRRAQVRDAVARHRARERLRALVDGVGAWLGGLTVRRRLLVLVQHETFAGIALAVAVAAAQITGSGPLEHAATLGHVAAAHAASIVERAVPVAVASAAELVEDEHGAAEDPAQRPRRGDAPERAHIDSPVGGEGDELWYWEDDDERDDEPVECVWSAAVDAMVCTPLTWGELRDASPVPVPDIPW